MAKQAVNGWFADLVTGAAKPIFEVLSQTALGTPPLDSPDMARAKDLWGVSQTIANTCYVLLVTVSGVLLIAGHSLPGSELTPGQLVARLVGAFAASNLSLVLIGYAIVFANGLSGAFLKAGAEAIDPGRVAKAIAGYLVASLIPNQPYTIFIGLGVVVLALCVVFIYIIRIALTMVLIAAAPVALMFHALPVTDGLARLWWRSITGVLAIGVCQALILATAFRLLFSDVDHPGSGSGDSGHFLGLASGTGIDLLLALCLLWIMVRVPSWAARTIWRAAHPSALTGLIKSLILYRGLGALMRHRVPTRKFWTPPPPPPSPPPPRWFRPPPGLSGPSRLALAPGSAPPALTSPGPSEPPPALPAGAISMPSGAFPMPPGPLSSPEPGSDRGAVRGPMQMSLPIPATGKSGKGGTRRVKQLALPVPVTRVARPPSSGGAVAGGQARVRSRQLLLPGMPRRPVPRRQLTLWTDPPKTRRRR
ncbi:hypothetical protein [Actinomadura geliboluensis]|uniref:Uncharacterized protein n=1 Tax=Actinomadura geliboluensis TaxID=882440 RepID=A0A5S4H817_9ACTN|nr:hypothetical protein [Actinomadura geliboluensis]TMR34980.1 hypothetical protein ETD96_24060 [Actinomadura geliboluensis]